VANRYVARRNRDMQALAPRREGIEMTNEDYLKMGFNPLDPADWPAMALAARELEPWRHE